MVHDRFRNVSMKYPRAIMEAVVILMVVGVVNETHPDRIYSPTTLTRILDPAKGIGPKTLAGSKLIVAATLVILVVSAVGISRIQINDNPVRWFRPDHRIRVAGGLTFTVGGNFIRGDDRALWGRLKENNSVYTKSRYGIQPSTEVQI